jgi:hypothetical protein
MPWLMKPSTTCKRAVAPIDEAQGESKVLAALLAKESMIGAYHGRCSAQLLLRGLTCLAVVGTLACVPEQSEEEKQATEACEQEAIKAVQNHWLFNDAGMMLQPDFATGS